MLTNKNSKFLFYRFNDFLQMRKQDMQLIRHLIIVEDQEGLAELQNRNWPYFIEKVIAITEDMNKVKIEEKENKILNEITRNYKICRRVYKSLYNSVADNFFEYLSTLLYYEISKLNEDIKTNGWSLAPDVRNYNGNVNLMRSMDFFFIWMEDFHQPMD